MNTIDYFCLPSQGRFMDLSASDLIFIYFFCFETEKEILAQLSNIAIYFLRFERRRDVANKLWHHVLKLINELIFS